MPVYLEKQKKTETMVVARSTLCFQSSLKTLARAPRAASNHRHTNTQRPLYKKKVIEREGETRMKDHRCQKKN